jgi:hypothetical protein
MLAVSAEWQPDRFISMQDTLRQKHDQQRVQEISLASGSGLQVNSALSQVKDFGDH